MKNEVEERPKIIIADDHPATRTLISALLQQLGYDDIFLARNGREALEQLKFAQLKKETYDLILSDWDMPEMDGLTLWTKISEDDALKNIPFVLITAMKEIEMVKKAISVGVTDYIVKPITLHALTNKVARALNKKPKT